MRESKSDGEKTGGKVVTEGDTHSGRFALGVVVGVWIQLLRLPFKICVEFHPCLEVLADVEQVDLVVAPLARDGLERRSAGRPACAGREDDGRRGTGGKGSGWACGRTFGRRSQAKWLKKNKKCALCCVERGCARCVESAPGLKLRAVHVPGLMSGAVGLGGAASFSIWSSSTTSGSLSAPFELP